MTPTPPKELFLVLRETKSGEFRHYRTSLKDARAAAPDGTIYRFTLAGQAEEEVVGSK